MACLTAAEKRGPKTTNSVRVATAARRAEPGRAHEAPSATPGRARAAGTRPGRGRDEAALLGSLPGSRRRAPRRAAGASCAEPCRAAPCRARRAPQGRAELPAAGHPGCSRRPPRRHFRGESRGRCNSTAACVITSSKRLRPPSALPNRARSSSAGPARSHRTFDIQGAFFSPLSFIFFFPFRQPHGGTCRLNGSSAPGDAVGPPRAAPLLAVPAGAPPQQRRWSPARSGFCCG